MCEKGKKKIGGEPASKYTEPKASSKRKATQDTDPMLSQSRSQGPTWNCLNPCRSSPPGALPCPAGTEGYPSPALPLPPASPGKGELAGLQGTPPSTPGAILHLDLLGTAPLQSEQLSESLRDILPMDLEKVGTTSTALLRYSALSSECNYPKHSHKTQSTIPAAFGHPGILAYR